MRVSVLEQHDSSVTSPQRSRRHVAGRQPHTVAPLANASRPSAADRRRFVLNATDDEGPAHCKHPRGRKGCLEPALALAAASPQLRNSLQWGILVCTQKIANGVKPFVCVNYF